MQYVWTCACCGKRYETLPMRYDLDAPSHWDGLPEAERESRAKLHTDFCTIDDQYFFVRACLEIAVLGRPEPFVWGVWTSLSRENFRRALELWHKEPLEREPARFGWLASAISIYPSTLNLRTYVRFRGNGERPTVELEPTDHPLAIEQHHGITVKRVQEIAAALQHRPPDTMPATESASRPRYA
jgi:hypothetical protein